MHFSIFLILYFYFATISRLNGVFEKDLMQNLLRPNPYDRITLDRKRPSIGFLLAHPDDETMFFTPTLKTLRKTTEFINHIDPEIHLLYLSNGDSEGKGYIRKQELSTLCEKYGYSCTVLDDPNLRDSPTLWNPEHSVPHIKDFIEKNGIRVLFTFDSQGVSGHPNHISTYHAAKYASSQLKNLKVYYLESVPLSLKYTSILSVHLGLFRKISVINLSPHHTLLNMYIHRSQFRFHVPFWSLFSSYSYINTYHF